MGPLRWLAGDLDGLASLAGWLQAGFSGGFVEAFCGGILWILLRWLAGDLDVLASPAGWLQAGFGGWLASQGGRRKWMRIKNIGFS